jgi:hypothetical protein
VVPGQTGKKKRYDKHKKKSKKSEKFRFIFCCGGNSCDTIIFSQQGRISFITVPVTKSTHKYGQLRAVQKKALSF